MRRTGSEDASLNSDADSALLPLESSPVKEEIEISQKISSSVDFIQKIFQYKNKKLKNFISSFELPPKSSDDLEINDVIKSTANRNYANSGSHITRYFFFFFLDALL